MGRYAMGSETPTSSAILKAEMALGTRLVKRAKRDWGETSAFVDELLRRTVLK